MSSLEINLFRHGHSLSNENPDIIAGQGDNVPLTELGERQAIALGYYLRGQDAPDLIDSSPLPRAHRTAELASGIAGFDLPIPEDPRLAEQHLGIHEGQRKDVVYTPELRRYIASKGAAYRHPGGQSMADVSVLMHDWLTERTNHMEEQGLGVMHAYSHNVAIAALLARVTGAESPIAMRNYVRELLKTKRIGNVSRTLIVIMNGQPSVELIGEPTDITAV